MPDYSVYYVIGREFTPPGRDFFDHLEETLSGNRVGIVQIREKNAGGKEFLQVARRSQEICAKYGTELVINDRLDIALILGCGLHVGQSDLPVSEARRLLGPDRIIGLSINTEAQLSSALAEGAMDYVGLGPIYGTATKKDHEAPIGWSGARALLRQLRGSRRPVPAVAIGGLNAKTATALLRRVPELDGIAVVSALAAAHRPGEAADELYRIVERCRGGGSAFGVAAGDIAGAGRLTTGATVPISAAQTAIVRVKDSATTPLIQHITNLVVMNDCANLTLAMGASPIMSSFIEDLDQLSPHLGALVLNFGSLSAEQLRAHIAAGQEANRNGKPVVIDPVAVGATTVRRAYFSELISRVYPAVIKGNAAEIGALAGSDEVASRGVDAVGSARDPAAMVRRVAREFSSVVVMTGEADYISDGTRTVTLTNGHAYQGLITGSGCMTTSAIGVLLALCPDPFWAAVLGLTYINVAAEQAAEQPHVSGPSSFKTAMLDRCHTLSWDDLRPVLEGISTSE